MGERKRPPASGHRNDSGGMGSMSKKSVQTGVSRRTIMAAGLAGAGALAMPSILRAQDRSLKVGVYGGYFKDRSEEHTSELQSLMRISYAVFCLKKKTNSQE